MVTTYILVRCTFPKTKDPIYGGWSVTYNSKGQRPVILVEQRQTVLLSGAAHRNLLPILSSAAKPHTGFTPIGLSF